MRKKKNKIRNLLKKLYFINRRLLPSILFSTFFLLQSNIFFIRLVHAENKDNDSKVSSEFPFNSGRAYSDKVSTSSWYDTDWPYRREVTIDNTGNPSILTDYPVRIAVTYDSDMQADFDDIRFVNSDDETLISYWRETWTASTSAVFWVKIPTIPASSQKIIYMYYGNASATSSSDGVNTFDFFDDFESYFPNYVVFDQHTSPSVVSLPNDNLLMVYSLDGDADVEQRTSSDYGESWGTAQFIDDGWISDINNINNTVYLTYTSPDWPSTAIYFRRSDNGGSSWGSRITVDDSSDFIDPIILPRSSTDVLIAVREKVGSDYYIRLYQSTDNGDTWGLKSTVLTDTTPFEDAFIFELSNNDLIVGAETETAELGESGLSYKISSNGGTSWGSEISFASGVGVDNEGTEFFYRSDGDLVGIYFTNEDEIVANNQYENYKIKYKISTDNGGSWGSSQTLLTNYRGGAEPHVVFTGDNKVIISNITYWAGDTGINLLKINKDLSAPEEITTASKWDNEQGKLFTRTINGTQAAEVQGYITGIATRGFINSVTFSDDDYILETRMRSIDGVNDEIRFAFRHQDASNHYLFLANTVDEQIFYKRELGGYSSLQSNSLPIDTNTWRKYRVNLVGDSIRVYIDEALVIDDTDSTFSSGRIALSSGSAFGWNHNSFTDWILVRRYTSVEPTSSVSSELALSIPDDDPNGNGLPETGGNIKAVLFPAIVILLVLSVFNLSNIIIARIRQFRKKLSSK